jgi:hypothetical protein
MKIINTNWTWRYSDNDEPDKFGRWGRKLLCGSLMVGYVGRIKSPTQEEPFYLASPYIPQTSNDSPFNHSVYNNPQDAMKYIEKCWDDFIKTIQQ